MSPLPDNALTALERARQAQERFERRIDVQLRLRQEDAMTTYAIRFDFPEGDRLFAGLHKGALGWAPTLETAKLFSDEDEARRYLENGYGASKTYGRVVTVKDGYPVA